MAHGLLQWRVTCGWSSVTWGECDKAEHGERLGACWLSTVLCQSLFPKQRDRLPQGLKLNMALSLICFKVETDQSR